MGGGTSLVVCWLDSVPRPQRMDFDPWLGKLKRKKKELRLGLIVGQPQP